MSIRWLSACGVVVPILDVLMTAWLGALDPGYSHWRQYISELGETGRPYAAVFSGWCILWGVLFAGFAVALARGLDGQKGSWLGPGALLVVAICSALCGVFPCDPGGAARTFPGQVHLFVGGWVGIPATILAPLLTWMGMRRSEAWRGYRTFAFAIALLLGATGAWLAVGHYAGLERATSAAGATQRLFLGIQYVWVEVVAIRLWKLAGQHGGRSSLA